MNLQIALIVLGVVLIAVIYLLSRWQQGWRGNWRTLRRQKKRFRPGAAEPSLEIDASDPQAPVAMESAADGAGTAVPGREDFLSPRAMDFDPGDGDVERNVFEHFEDPAEATAVGRETAGEEEDRAPTLDTRNVGTDGPGEDGSEDGDKDVIGRESEQAAAVDSPALESDPDLQPAPGFDKLSQIDYYVKLSGGRDVSRESVLAVYREAAIGLSKAHSVYGLRLPDKIWSDIEHEPEEARFGDLVMTVQLADGNGPMSQEDMTRFSSLVVKLSESTGRGFSFMAPMESAHQQAFAIDRLRRKYDSIFVINVRPAEGEYFDGASVDRCASQIGLIPDDSGFYARYKPVDKQKICLYSLANMTDTGQFDIRNMRGTRTRGVTFFTRPAVNCLPGAVFSEMADAAKAFASRIKGEAVAPGYEGLSSDNVEAIRRSIEQVAGEMESYGIVPGSQEAIRLF